MTAVNIRQIGTYALFILAALTMPSAHAAWVEVESENFIFVGETSEKAGTRIIHDLEIYRSTVLAIVGIADSPEQRKVRVYGLRGSSRIHRVTGLKDVAGVYTAGNDYPVFVTDVSGGRWSIRSTSYHEFAHHIINTYSSSYYPRWYNEGFAEYLASFEVKKDRVIIGRPSTDFAYTLNDPNWLSIEFMTNAITEYPFENNGSVRENLKAQLFYGMSWIAVHYIQNTPKYKDRFSSYIERLNQGIEPTTAFEESFDVVLFDFYRELRRYWKKDRFNMFHFDADTLVSDPTFKSRTLEEGEAEARLAEIRVMFLRNSDDHERARKKTHEKLNDLIAEFGERIEFSSALVSLAITENDDDGALAIAEASYARNPDDINALRTLADALFHRHPPGEQPTEEDYLRSRELFARVIELDPMNPTANSHYPDTFIYASEEPDDMALRAVNVDLQFHRNPSNFSTYLKAAEIYRLAGRPDYSCALLERVAPWIRRNAANRPSDETDAERTAKDQQLQRVERMHELTGSSCESN